MRTMLFYDMVADGEPVKLIRPPGAPQGVVRMAEDEPIALRLGWCREPEGGVAGRIGTVELDD